MKKLLLILLFLPLILMSQNPWGSSRICKDRCCRESGGGLIYGIEGGFKHDTTWDKYNSDAERLERHRASYSSKYQFHYNQPEEIDVINAEYNSFSGTNFPDFRPIGWNGNLDFAYQIIISDGGFGVTENSIYVISATTGEILEEINLIDRENHDGSLDENQWLKNQEKINRILSAHRIYDKKDNMKFYTNSSLKSLINRRYPSITPKDLGQIVIHKDQKLFPCESNEYEEFSVDYKILLRKKEWERTGSIIIKEGSLDCLIKNLVFEGYFISPYKEYILIISSSATRGFEGEEDYHLHFEGFNLREKAHDGYRRFF